MVYFCYQAQASWEVLRGEVLEVRSKDFWKDYIFFVDDGLEFEND